MNNCIANNLLYHSAAFAQEMPENDLKQMDEQYSAAARFIAMDDGVFTFLWEMNFYLKKDPEGAEEFFTHCLSKGGIDQADLNGRLRSNQASEALRQLWPQGTDAIGGKMDQLYALTVQERLNQLGRKCLDDLCILCAECDRREMEAIENALVATFPSHSKEVDALCEAEEILQKKQGGKDFFAFHLEARLKSLVPSKVPKKPSCDDQKKRNAIERKLTDQDLVAFDPCTALADSDIHGLRGALARIERDVKDEEACRQQIYAVLTGNGQTGLRSLLERQITPEYSLQHKRWAMTGYVLLVSEYASRLNPAQRRNLYQYLHDSQRIRRGLFGTTNSTGYEAVMKDKSLYQTYKMLKAHLANGESLMDFAAGKRLIDGTKADFAGGLHNHPEASLKPAPFGERALYKAFCGGDLNAFEAALRENTGNIGKICTLLTLTDPSGHSALRGMLEVESERKGRFHRFLELVAEFAPVLNPEQQKGLQKHISDSLKGPVLGGIGPTMASMEMLGDAKIRQKYAELSAALSEGGCKPQKSSDGPPQVDDVPPSNHVETLHQKIFPGRFTQVERDLIKEVDSTGLLNQVLMKVHHEKQHAGLHDLFHFTSSPGDEEEKRKALGRFLSIINRVAPGKPNWWQKSLYQRLHESQKIPSSFGTNTQDYERFSKRCPDLHAVYQGVKSALKTGDCTPETITSLMEKHMFAHEKAKVFKP